MPTEYLGTAAVAERTGLAVATVRSYILKDLMPEADVIITTPSGPLRGWAPETIDAWLASRPGQGARTDLRKWRASLQFSLHYTLLMMYS